jgi:hypothetical protein
MVSRTQAFRNCRSSNSLISLPNPGLPMPRHRCRSNVGLRTRVPRPCPCAFCRDRAGILTPNSDTVLPIDSSARQSRETRQARPDRTIPGPPNSRLVRGLALRLPQIRTPKGPNQDETHARRAPSAPMAIRRNFRSRPEAQTLRHDEPYRPPVPRRLPRPSHTSIRRFGSRSSRSHRHPPP